MAAAQLRAPLYEDKVVDFLFSKAEISDRAVTRAELEADLESEEGHVHGPGCGHDHAAGQAGQEGQERAKKAEPRQAGRGEGRSQAQARPSRVKDGAGGQAGRRPSRPSRSRTAPGQEAAAKKAPAKAK